MRRRVYVLVGAYVGSILFTSSTIPVYVNTVLRLIGSRSVTSYLMRLLPPRVTTACIHTSTVSTAKLVRRCVIGASIVIGHHVISS